jgi:hypothetical protein
MNFGTNYWGLANNEETRTPVNSSSVIYAVCLRRR